MKKQNASKELVTAEPKRRLSPIRVTCAILLLIGIIASMVIWLQHWQDTQVVARKTPWFAAYVDITATPKYAFEQLGTTQTRNAMLAFIVASPSDPCTPSWGGAYTLDQASGGLDLDRRIARLRQQGGNVSVSFGGLINQEIALTCKDPNLLLNAYQSVVDRYDIDTIDLDLEGSGLTDIVASKRRAIAIATLQSKRRAKKKSLAVWLTLPVSPQGLTVDGTNAVAIMLSNKVDVAGVNGMTMDYSNSRDAHETMEHASERALTELHRQLGILYKQAGIALNSATLWTKIGATPMIGQNDVIDEVFSLEDASGLNEFAISNGLGRMSMWSANRDIPCGSNYIDLKIVSDSCSGVKQDKLDFATMLGKSFTGTLQQNAGVVTTEDPDARIQKPDDPQNSPYQIWQDSGAYLTGTKVVWHRNVYQAKWWTRGDMPDNPVLQSYQTPWQLLGPVLPGEKPIPQPTLPPGTYPQWTGTDQYDAGQRVLLNGIPYQAKWWNTGESPDAATANPDSSPWVPLTQQQINELMEENNASGSAAAVVQ